MGMRTFDDLCFAVAKDNAAEVAAIVAGGTRVTGRDSSGDTPLHYAANAGSRPAVMQLLLDYGTDINARNNAGRTPLIDAILAGTNDVVKFLLDKGADAQIADAQNLSPRDYAQKTGNTEAKRLLWQHCDAPDLKMEMFQAIRAGRLADLKFLVEEMKTDLFARSPAGIRACDEAQAMGSEIAQYVSARQGAADAGDGVAAIKRTPSSPPGGAK